MTFLRGFQVYGQNSFASSVLEKENKRDFRLGKEWTNEDFDVSFCAFF